jgi:hypothetical protein
MRVSNCVTEKPQERGDLRPSWAAAPQEKKVKNNPSFYNNTLVAPTNA